MKTADLAALMDAALTGGALPGEDEGFGADERADAAHFVARAMERRPFETKGAGAPAMLLEPMVDVTGQRMHRLAIINDDMPFLVDSVAQALAADGVHLYRLIHPVVQVARDAKGALTSAGGEGEGKRESVIYIEMAALSAKAADALPAKMEAVLTDVRAATADWMKMKVVLSDAADSLTAIHADSERCSAGCSTIISLCWAAKPAPPTARAAIAWAWRARGRIV